LIEETKPELEGNFPVILVDKVNHAQVAAGKINVFQNINFHKLII
jgi:hypothetical protein